MKLSKRRIAPPPTKRPFAALWLCLVLTLPAARADEEEGGHRGRSCRYVTPVWEKSDFGECYPLPELPKVKLWTNAKTGGVVTTALV